MSLCWKYGKNIKSMYILNKFRHIFNERNRFYRWAKIGSVGMWCDIVVINTECEGVCYRIYARQKFQIIIKEFLPGVYPVTNARAWGIYYYYKDRPIWFQETCLYFDEVKRTRTPPYCFECMVALVKADKLTTDTQSGNRNNTSVSKRAIIGGFTPC